MIAVTTLQSSLVPSIECPCAQEYANSDTLHFCEKGKMEKEPKEQGRAE